MIIYIAACTQECIVYILTPRRIITCDWEEEIVLQNKQENFLFLENKYFKWTEFNSFQVINQFSQILNQNKLSRLTEGVSIKTHNIKHCIIIKNCWCCACVHVDYLIWSQQNYSSKLSFQFQGISSITNTEWTCIPCLFFIFHFLVIWICSLFFEISHTWLASKSISMIKTCKYLQKIKEVGRDVNHPILLQKRNRL